MKRLVSLLPCTLALLAACGDDSGEDPPTDIDARPPTSDAAEAVDAAPGPNGGTPGPSAVGLAAVNSDFSSTSISLLDPATGEVVNGDCINSGTVPPGTTLALSGDVVLPSQAQPENLLLAIDRTNSALTWIDPDTCTPLRQLDVSTSFYSNPHDVIGLSPTKAYVPRYEQNRTPTDESADYDEGDDLLIIDPSIPEITGRIDLSGYAVPVEGATIQARPDRALLVGDRVFVALSNLSGDFQAAGHGRLVVIDTATDEVTGAIDIPDFKNCSGLSYVESTQTLAVACGGAFSDPDQAAGSGIVYFDVGASPPVEIGRQTADVFGGRPLAGFAVNANQGPLGFVVTYGDFGGEPSDQLWALDVEAGTAVSIADASDSFTYGDVLVDTERERAYLTDAAEATPRVHVYEYANPADPTLETSINVNPKLGLPPRDIAWY